jgi:hypothetical protein
MGTPLPVLFQNAPLPANWQGTPSQFADALTARLSLVQQDDLSFFGVGSILPTTNQGPFLLNFQTWYVWDDVTGAYIPLVLASESLGYIAQQTAPDPTKYTFWIQLDSNGNPIAINYYYSGAWVDIYATQFSNYSTTEQINQILSNGTSSYPARAISANPNFSIACDSNLHACLFNVDTVDPFSVFDAANSWYVAPVAGVYMVASNLQLDNNGANAATVEFSYRTSINGNPDGNNNIIDGNCVPSPSGNRWYTSLSGLIQLNQNDTVQINLSGTDNVGTGAVTCSNGSFSMYLVQRL